MEKEHLPNGKIDKKFDYLLENLQIYVLEEKN